MDCKFLFPVVFKLSAFFRRPQRYSSKVSTQCSYLSDLMPCGFKGVFLDDFRVIFDFFELAVYVAGRQCRPVSAVVRPSTLRVAFI